MRSTHLRPCKLIDVLLPLLPLLTYDLVAVMRLLEHSTVPPLFLDELPVRLV